MFFLQKAICKYRLTFLMADKISHNFCMQRISSIPVKIEDGQYNASNLNCFPPLLIYATKVSRTIRPGEINLHAMFCTKKVDI